MSWKRRRREKEADARPEAPQVALRERVAQEPGDLARERWVVVVAYRNHREAQAA